MSRRDTVIIAVLLNAGLLIVLFATSLKSDKIEDAPSAITVLASHQPETKETTFPKFTPAPLVSDQVDQVLEKYITPQVDVNFLADLHPVGHPVGQSIAAPSISEVSKEKNMQESGFKEITVKKGDVLERIAKQHHVTVGDIMKASHLTTTRLKIGQVLKIPAASATVSLSNHSQDERYYTIQTGDNPWMIAVKHHMKVEELLKLNGLDEQKARRLKAGDKIRIR